jgi:hypothetical protein
MFDASSWISGVYLSYTWGICHIPWYTRPSLGLSSSPNVTFQSFGSSLFYVSINIVGYLSKYRYVWCLSNYIPMKISHLTSPCFKRSKPNDRPDVRIWGAHKGTGRWRYGPERPRSRCQEPGFFTVRNGDLNNNMINMKHGYMGYNGI